MKKKNKKLPHTIKLSITKTSLGYTVYDATSKDRIDIFPDNKEGRERLLEWLKAMTGKKVAPFFED